jgi:hypothetical protein
MKITNFHSENLKGGNYEDLGIDWRLILEWIVKRWGGSVWNGFSWLRIDFSGLSF